MSREAFPAPGCVFSRHGFCLREEEENPGYHTGYACRRLAAFVRQWDDFLDRAEAFHLSERTAAAIWNARRHVLQAPPSWCPPENATREPQELVRCCYFHHGACAATMPRCVGGECSLYKGNIDTVHRKY